MLKMNLKNSCLFLTLICFVCSLTLVSCDKNRVFDEYKSVGNAWNKDSIVSFDLPKVDSTKQYNLYINIRSNNKYQFNNLFLIVSLEQPDKRVKVDTLEYLMTDENGALLGDGFTDVKDSRLYYKEKMKFKSGDYKLHIKHALRQTGKIVGVEKLEGITDVGFRIEKLD